MMTRVEKARQFRAAASLSAQTATDAQALAMPTMYPLWAEKTAYGGENLEVMQKRIVDFMDDLTHEPEDAQIAVVCHEGAIFCMLCHVLQCRPDRLAARSDNCSISVFTYKSGNWTLNKWNETGNLIPEA